MAGVKNCGVSERERVKNCKKQGRSPLINNTAKNRRVLSIFRSVSSVFISGKTFRFYAIAFSMSAGAALSPKVLLTWTKRSLLPGANTKLPPSCKGSFPRRCCLCPAAFARLRACRLSLRKRSSREAWRRPTIL
jgi:hypothetical protein